MTRGLIPAIEVFLAFYIFPVPVQLKLEVTDPRVIPDLSVAAFTRAFTMR